jgi:hypothetical protein
MILLGFGNVYALKDGWWDGNTPAIPPNSVKRKRSFEPYFAARKIRSLSSAALKHS